MTSISVHLEPSSIGSSVYLPGELLKGTVQLSLEYAETFRALHISVFGEARVHWTETRATRTAINQQTHSVDFEGKQVFLKSRTYFFGQGGGSFDIQPGVHKYNFAYHLPEHLPYTLDESHGEIKYYAEAILEIPSCFDKKIKTQFRIVRHDDLNNYPELKVAQKFEEYKKFKSWFGESGPLLMHVTVPHTGFAKGQSVPLKIKYFNDSDVDVIATKIRLKRGIHYTSEIPHEKTKSEINVMVEKMARGVKKGKSVQIDCNLDIPRVMLNSNRRNCRVITIEYFIEIEGEVSGDHPNIEISFPITIGSLPLTFDSQYFSPINNTRVVPLVPIAPILPTVIIPTVPVQPSAPTEEQLFNDLPPSFDDAIKMGQPKYATSIAQPISLNVGWTVSGPSAPSNEKS